MIRHPTCEKNSFLREKELIMKTKWFCYNETTNLLWRDNFNEILILYNDILTRYNETSTRINDVFTRYNIYTVTR